MEERKQTKQDKDFYVSNLWNIKSFKRGMEYQLKLRKNGDWYYIVTTGDRKTVRVHRMVAEMFIPNPEWKKCINHKNWIRTDNVVENLEWCTYGENELHKYRILWVKPIRRWKLWIEHNRSKKVTQLDLEWNIIKLWDSVSDIERILWYKITNIACCCRGKVKTSNWFIWKYI